MGMTADFYCENCDVFDFAPHPPDVCLRERTRSDAYLLERFAEKGLLPGKHTVVVGRSSPPKSTLGMVYTHRDFHPGIPNLDDEPEAPARVLSPAEERAVAELERRRAACLRKAKAARDRWLESNDDRDLEDALEAMKREDSLDSLQLLIEDPTFWEKGS